jgi:PDZ domain-containing protein
LPWALFVVLFVGVAVGNTVKMDYVIERPGQVFNVLGEVKSSKIISIAGHESYPTEGQFDLLTVSIVGNPDNPPSFWEYWFAKNDPEQSIIPMDEIYPPGVDTKTSYAEDAQMMQDSQQDAIAAALNEMGVKFTTRAYVVALTDGSASDGIIAPGDYIETFNGIKIYSGDQLSKLINESPENTKVSMRIEHKGKLRDVEVLPKKIKGRLYVGIFVSPKYVFPFDVNVNLANVGGPSGGLIFALGIYDKLTPGALSGGEHFAGTGTIDSAGNVGPIGGIVMKMVGAKRAGAKYFFSPAENCAETVGHVPNGLQVFKTATFDDALKVIDTVKNGGDLSALPKCTP